MDVDLLHTPLSHPFGPFLPMATLLKAQAFRLTNWVFQSSSGAEKAWGQLCNLARVGVGKPFFLSKKKTKNKTKKQGEKHIAHAEHGSGGSKQLKFPSPVPSVRFDLVGGAAAVTPNPPSNSMAANAGNKIRNAKLVRIPCP